MDGACGKVLDVGVELVLAVALLGAGRIMSELPITSSGRPAARCWLSSATIKKINANSSSG